MADGLVLSLFPGIGLLDHAFELEGFTVVRGPDILWGGDVRRFHPPAGVFDGVIGGPPCQAHSPLANINRAMGNAVAPDLIPEFCRVVAEAAPTWWIMENVERAPVPAVDGYASHPVVVNNRQLGGEQNRVRRFTLGTRDGRRLRLDFPTAAIAGTFEPAVTTTVGGRRASVVIDANGRSRGNQGLADHSRLCGRSIERECELQGLPPDFLADAPFTAAGRKRVVANGVPIPMGRAIARAVRETMARSERIA